MTNYAAAPIQPIINGLISLVGEVPAPVFTGRGIFSIARTLGTTITQQAVDPATTEVLIWRGN